MAGGIQDTGKTEARVQGPRSNMVPWGAHSDSTGKDGGGIRAKAVGEAGRRSHILKGLEGQRN